MKNYIRKKVLALLLLSNSICIAQQTNSIKGTLINLNNEAVPFATIALRKTTKITQSNLDGKFEINNLSSGTYVVEIKCIGYKTKLDTLFLSTSTNYKAILEFSNENLDEVVVKATRVTNQNGMVFNNLSKEEISKQNLGLDAPMILNQLPNVVANSDAGNGIGYTGIRIRGTDGTRINVTINGVPVNDAESQGTFWVNMPDLLSSANNIQVQRGVGASSNGAGAFGATINFQTNQLNEKAYANVISTAGSFNTLRTTLAAGTGLLNNKFTLDARASRITSDGYVDRASSNLQSYYLSAAYYGKKSVLKFINFLGQEKTYQAWYYVPEDTLKKGNRTYNSAGAYYDTDGKLKHYSNETDNYKQNNFQLHFISTLNSRCTFNVTAHYTKGAGYYEQYKQNQLYSNYNLNDVVTAKGDTLTSTDLIRRLWLNNDFAGGLFNFNLTANNKLKFIIGGGGNTYFGKHYGKLRWLQNASNGEIDHEYYFNTANKTDLNFFIKTNYTPTSKLAIYLDLQGRQVDYKFLGYDDLLRRAPQIASYFFFNPKLGTNYSLNKNISVYASFAVANKEPNRDDFIQSNAKSRPKYETLYDTETGIKYINNSTVFNCNLFNMNYKNQLVLNGQVNNVGAYNRVNVDKSYRRGIELEFQKQIVKWFVVNSNLSLSSNKINGFTEFIDSSDAAYTVYTQYKINYTQTDISFSPSVVAGLQLIFKPIKNLEITFSNKYVGRQYLDNTSNNKRSINPYNVVDARLNYAIKTKFIPEINFMFSLYNVLNTKYETNGYTFSYYTDAQLITQNFYAPAAPINFLGGVSLRF